MMSRRTLVQRAVLLGLVGLLAAAGSAGGQTVVYVDAAATGAGDGTSWDDAFTAVQPGLNAAQSGDQVWVAAGTYVGTITLKLGVALYGGFAGHEDPATFDLADRDFAAHETILDGNQAGSVVTAPPGATATTRIDGFVITNGSGTPSGALRHGGGIYCVGSSPTIANNRIAGNAMPEPDYVYGGGIYCGSSSTAAFVNNAITGNSAELGGGVYCQGSTPTIANNTISNNSADFAGGGLYLSSSSPTISSNTITGNHASEGGGLHLFNSSSPTITNNTITGNSAGGGGGLYLSSSSPTISSNTITGNSAWEGGGMWLLYSSATIANNAITYNNAEYGGGIHCRNSSLTIANNSIRGNNANNSGGGIYCRDSSPAITNSAITGNGAGSGGGIYCTNASPAIANNTIAGNGAAGLYLSSSSAIIANTVIAFNWYGIYKSGSGTLTLRHNCVYGNTAYDYSGVTDPTGSNGNIKQDPILADGPYGNVHVQLGSPCVDAGNSDYVQAGWTDMDGQPRGIGAGVDIGADESDGTVWPAGPYAVVRVSPEGDDAHDGSDWALAKRTVQAGIDAASALGGEVWVQAGTYPERIILHAYAYLYGGFAGTEAEREERDWRANATVLDGQQGGSVVSARAGNGALGTIDGFTIANGSTTGGGGGLVLSYSSPTIANNTITGNSASSGGGLGLYRSSPTLANNTITDNTASSGGGLYLFHSSPTVTNNRIEGNAASGTSYGGGGLCMLQYSSPTIANNTITGNSASRYGGGLYLNSSSPTIANNTITGNTAFSGGGLGLYQSSPTITNNRIEGNAASGTNFDAGGGGIHCSDSSPAIANNTITHNTASSGGGLFLFYSVPTIANTLVTFNSSGVRRWGATSVPTLRYNCVYGNTAYNYSGITDPTGAYGNISADPRFVQMPSPGSDGQWGTADDDYGDVRLLGGSPCIDAGSNGAVPHDTLDLDGDGDVTEPLPFDLAGRPRFIDDPFTDDTGSGTAPIVDMGAYEYQVPGDLDGDSDVDGSDYALLLAAFGSCSGGANYLPAADADEDGCVTLVDYQLWLQGYREFIGEPLAPPPPLPDWEPDPDPRPVPRPPPRPTAGNGGVIGEGALQPAPGAAL